MQSWRHESLFAEFIAEEDLVAASIRTPRRPSSAKPNERAAILQSAIQSLQRLQLTLVGHEHESSWVGQILAYLYRLQTSAPAQTPEEQFSHLYMLRKWLFWVPVSLLQRPEGKGPAMLTLSHLYATALSLEPLFPDLGSSFCAALALPPLEAIINLTSAMQSEQGADPASMEIGSMMQYPQQTALSYRQKAMHAQTPMSQQENPMFAINPDTLSYTTIGNLSPAFAPSTPAHYSSQTNSAAQSPFLEVPIPTHPGFGYGTSSWGAMPSPGFPPQVYTTQEEQMYGYGMSAMSLGAFRSGFVSPASVWT